MQTAQHAPRKYIWFARSAAGPSHAYLSCFYTCSMCPHSHEQHAVDIRTMIYHPSSSFLLLGCALV
jgi:hypothetical protein